MGHRAHLQPHRDGSLSDRTIAQQNNLALQPFWLLFVGRTTSSCHIEQIGWVRSISNYTHFHERSSSSIALFATVANPNGQRKDTRVGMFVLFSPTDQMLQQHVHDCTSFQVCAREVLTEEVPGPPACGFARPVPAVKSTDILYRGFKRKGGCVHIITFRVTTILQSKSSRSI